MGRWARLVWADEWAQGQAQRETHYRQGADHPVGVRINDRDIAIIRNTATNHIDEGTRRVHRHAIRKQLYRYGGHYTVGSRINEGDVPAARVPAARIRHIDE